MPVPGSSACPRRRWCYLQPSQQRRRPGSSRVGVCDDIASPATSAISHPTAHAFRVLTKGLSGLSFVAYTEYDVHIAALASAPCFCRAKRHVTGRQRFDL